jgi:hypothetical protein
MGQMSNVPLGASSTSLRDDGTAFTSQLEGMIPSRAPYIVISPPILLQPRLYPFSDVFAATESPSIYRHVCSFLKREFQKYPCNIQLTFHPVEVDRAIDNLVKSGKLYNGSSRRDSLPMMMNQRPYSEYGAECFDW